MEQRVATLERRVLDLGKASVEARLRAEALEAVAFGLALTLAANVRAPGVSPGQNADLLMQGIEHFAEFDAADPIAAQRWGYVSAFGERLVAVAGAWSNRPGERG